MKLEGGALQIEQCNRRNRNYVVDKELLSITAGSKLYNSTTNKICARLICETNSYINIQYCNMTLSDADARSLLLHYY